MCGAAFEILRGPRTWLCKACRDWKGEWCVWCGYQFKPSAADPKRCRSCDIEKGSTSITAYEFIDALRAVFDLPPVSAETHRAKMKRRRGAA